YYNRDGNKGFISKSIDGGVERFNLYKTTNSGESWSLISNTPNDIFSIGIDKNDPDNLYVGSYGYIYKSTDGGVSWKSKRISTENCRCLGIKVNPNNSDVIYGYGYYYSSSSGYNICFYKSEDAGENWTVTPVKTSTDYLRSDKNYWAVDKTDYNTIYIAAYYSSSGYYPFLFRSTDAGETWEDLSINITISPNFYISCLDVDKNRNIILNAWGKGIYKSSDYGNTWSRISSSRRYLYSIKSYSDNPDILVGGYDNSLYTSNDGGFTWNYNANLKGSFYSIIINSEDKYYAGNSSAVFKTTDGGNIWNRSASGMYTTNIHAIAVSKSNPDIIYAGINNDGIFKSTDRGTNWVKVMNLPDISSIVVDENSPDIVYAVEDG
ncbi:hypothetical protein ACFL4T_10630, partial [candidate division KSB1 bacterium]